jgi:hypothetical protein
MENKPDKLNYRDMKLRDHFAARAMQGTMSGNRYSDQINKLSDLAKISYQVADAMIKQREIATLQLPASVVTALQFAYVYIQYIKKASPRLHAEADGSPSAESQINSVIETYVK